MKRQTAMLFAFTVLVGCEGRQSVLDTAGADAEVLARLFWVMLVGAIALWVAVNALIFYVTRLSPGPGSSRFVAPLIVGGGIIFPTLVLIALLGWGLSIMPDQRAPGEGLVVKVRAEQWWWRVEYWPEGASAPIVSANEIRLPVGQRSEFKLSADRVIHSFWVPALGGKMDMFPGRETRLSLLPTKEGIYRGQCAEFCGASHALMGFEVVAMAPEAFAAWLAAEAKPAMEPADQTALRGRDVFFAQGCGACHALRGTQANGAVGPDLTHVGTRKSLGAGTLAPTVQNFEDWIGHTAAFKPEVEMPDYSDLDPEDLRALAVYMKGLQ